MITAFHLRDPFEMRFNLSEDRRTYAIDLHVQELPPDQHLSPVIGEVIHNIASAVDAIAWETATAAAPIGTVPEHGVRFPIVSTDTPTSRRELTRALRPFSGIPAACEVIELVQPREAAGCHDLVLLESLWNFDKHRGVHQTVPMQVHGDGTSSSIFSDMPLDRDAPLVVPVASGTSAVAHPPDWKPPWPEDSTWAVAFGPPPSATMMSSAPYVGAPVLSTLKDILAAVRGRIVRPLGRILDS